MSFNTGCGYDCADLRRQARGRIPCDREVKCRPVPVCDVPYFGKRLAANLCADKVIPAIDDGCTAGYVTFSIDNYSRNVKWCAYVQDAGDIGPGQACVDAGVHLALTGEDNDAANLVKTLSLERFDVSSNNRTVRFGSCCRGTFLYCGSGCWTCTDSVQPLTATLVEQLATGALNFQFPEDTPLTRGQIICYEKTGEFCDPCHPCDPYVPCDSCNEETCLGCYSCS